MKILKSPCNLVSQKLTLLPKILMLVVFFNTTTHAQIDQPYSLGDEKDFSQNLLNHSKSKEITLKLSASNSVKGRINVKTGNINNYSIIGSISDNDTSTFSISKNEGIIEGQLVLKEEQKAYLFYSGDNQDILVKEVDIHEVLCVEFEKTEEKETDKGLVSKRVPDLQSLPGAKGTVYLDFDGEVVSGTQWLGGATINAQPTGYSDAKITAIWQIMAEDFRPFNINITTNRDVFEATPKNRRMMCIFTPTTDAAPGSGGVAYVNSFSSNNDTPCWTFNSGTRSAGETGSHEVGHTLGLSHDGTVGGTTYYAGHGEWSPIMGWSASKPIGHWSKGEYDNANQGEDDMAIISNNRNGLGYNVDDYGDTIADASELIVASDGNVSEEQNTGLISTKADKDVFSFITAGGEVNLNLKPDPYYPNLNIEVRVLNSLGDEVAVSNPNQDLSATINTTLEGGTYFLEIDGKGEGNLSNGYSDYASVGLYSISGSYAPGDNNQPPVSNFDAVIACSQVTFNSTSINTVDSYLWDFGDGTTSVLQNPDHTYTANGQYTVSLTVTNAIGSDTNTKENFVDIIVATLPDDASTDACSGESISLELSGSNGYIWYDQPQGGTIVNTGSTFEIASITASQTYYVSGTTKPIVTANTGMVDINTNNGDIHNGGFYLVFDAVEPLLLKKAKVFAQGAGNRTLELKNESGEVLESKTINIPDGENVIDIELNVPAGNNMEIGFAEGADLFRNNSGINYPYQVADVVSIKRSTATTDPEGFYYYLYDWQVTTLGECETEDRTVIAINVNELPEKPTLILTSGNNQIQVNEVFSGYQWYLDDVAIQGATDQSYIAQEEGVYTVEVFNDVGCSAFSDGLTIDVLSTDDFSIVDVYIYPNPTNDILNISGLDSLKEVHDIRIINTLGQLIKKYQLNDRLDVSSLEDGLYFIKIGSRFAKQFVKISN